MFDRIRGSFKLQIDIKWLTERFPGISHENKLTINREVDPNPPHPFRLCILPPSPPPLFSVSFFVPCFFLPTLIPRITISNATV